MRNTLARFVLLLLGGFTVMAQAQPGDQDHGRDRCLLQKLAEAADTTPVSEIRAACAPLSPTQTIEQTTASSTLTAPAATASSDTQLASPAPDDPPPVITQRLKEEAQTYQNRYAMTPHRPNYLMFGSYAQHRPSNATFVHDTNSDAQAQKVESKFQISFKAPVWLNALNSGGDLFAGYTQRSFWQTYNTEASSPFRETDYEPEVWYQHPINTRIAGWNVSTVALGFNHQSNGRGQDYSRSWNRIFGLLAVEKGNTAVVLRPWWRVPERQGSDDNPDITHYMGHFDLTLLHKSGEHSFDLMLRNNLHRNDNRGAVQLGWSFPLTQRFRGYVQWFYGYGESLIDYKTRQNAIGVGVQLVDW